MNYKFSLYQRLSYGYIQFVEHFLGKRRGMVLTNGVRKRFFKKLHASMVKNGPGKIIPVERRKDISLKEFRKHYLRKGIPLILEGRANDWGCCKTWSIDFFKENYGDDTVTILDQNIEDLPYYRIKFRKILEDITAGSKYLRFYPFLKKHPERIEDFDYRWLRSMRNKFTVAEAFQVFIGGKNMVTPMHHASQGNLFIQAFGEKKWVIYPFKFNPVVDPEPARNIYRNAPFKTPKGSFNPFDPDYETPYTLFRYIDGYEVHLKPGDILWNPPFYWHTILNPTDSIGISYKWIAPLYNFRLSPLYYLLEMFATSPPVWKSYKLFQEEFNLLNIAEKGRLKKFREELENENSPGS